MICFAMFIGSTYAWFTDSASTGVNRIQAGNLDIEVKHKTGNGSYETVDLDTHLFEDVKLWEPGVVSYENIKIENVGNLAAKVKMSLRDVVKNSFNGHDLTEVIKVNVIDGEFSGTREQAKESVGFATFQTFEKAFTLAANTGTPDSKTYGIILYWEPTENDNLYNLKDGATADDGRDFLDIQFGIDVVATQNTVESDSFDEQYDANATYPTLGSVINRTEEVSLAGLTIYSTTTTDTSGAIIGETPITETDGGKLEKTIKTTAASSDSTTYDISYNFVRGETSTPVVAFDSVQTNVINLSAGLENVKVTHSHGNISTEMTPGTADNKIDGTYYYEKSTGKLTIHSKIYSVFDVTYTSDFVAAVDSQGYYTVQDAVDSAKDGQIIAVLKDIRSNEPVFEVSDKEIIVDLNKHIIDYYDNLESECMYAVGVNGTAHLTIKNGTICTEALQSDGICVNGNEAILNVENVSFNVCEVGVSSYGTGNYISINNSTISSNHWGIYQNGSNGKNSIKVSNTTIIDSCEDGSGIYISNNAYNDMQTLIVENSNVLGATGIEIKHTNASITGSTLSATGNPAEFEENNNGSTAIGYCFAITSNSTPNSIDITRGTIEFGDVVFMPVVSGCEVFNSSASQGVNNGAVINGYENTHVLSPDKLLPDCSVKNSDKIYYSLFDLKAEKASNLKSKTIILNNDVVLNDELYLYGKNFNLDLNGHSVSLKYGAEVKPNNYATIYIGGKYSNLTIIDSSTEKTGSVYGPELTVSGYAPCAVRTGNYGKLNIKGGNYYGLGDGNPAIFTCTSMASSTAATVKIYDGKFMSSNPFNGIYYVLNHQDSSTTGCKMTIYGGTFVNYEPGVTPVDAKNAKTGKIALASGYKIISENKGNDIWYTVVAE